MWVGVEVFDTTMLRAGAVHGVSCATLRAVPPGDDIIGAIDESIVAMSKYRRCVAWSGVVYYIAVTEYIVVASLVIAA